MGLDPIVQSAKPALKTPSVLGKERQDSALISLEGTQASFRQPRKHQVSDGHSPLIAVCNSDLLSLTGVDALNAAYLRGV